MSLENTNAVLERLRRGKLTKADKERYPFFAPRRKLTKVERQRANEFAQGIAVMALGIAGIVALFQYCIANYHPN